MTQEEKEDFDAGKVLEKYACECEICFSLAALIAHEFGFIEESRFATKRVFSYNPNNKLVANLFPELQEVIDEIGKVVDARGRLLEKDPENWESWKILGHCFLTLSDFPNAFAAYGHAMAINPASQDLVMLYGLGLLYQHFRYNENAISLFLKILRLDPNSPFGTDIRFRLGILYRNLKRFDTSIEYFSSVLDHPPSKLKSDDVSFQIAFTRQLAGEVDRAISEYESLMDRNPKVAGVAQQFLLASMSKEKTHPGVSTAALAKVMVNHSKNPTIRFLAARIAAMNNDFVGAYGHYSYCVPYIQDDPTFWLSFGVLYMKSEQLEDARLAFQRALVYKNDAPEPWLNLGLSYIRQNDLAKATETYETAMRICGPLVELVHRLEKIRRGDKDIGRFMIADVREGELVQDVPLTVAIRYSASVPPLPPACFEVGETGELFGQLSIPCDSLFDVENV